MITTPTLKFLKALRTNNNKEWFDKNKDQYLTSKDNVSGLVDLFLAELGRIDKEYKGLTSKDCLFRIYRDVRFSKDKRPYKTNLGASMNPGGKKAINAGYYLHIEPGKSFLAGGIWMPPGDVLKKIRQEIDYNGKEINSILNKKEFKKLFGELDPEYRLKTTPKGYSKDHPDIDLLKLTSFIAWREFSDAEIQKKNFVAELGKSARVMKPFIDFLNRNI
jgi:uncharacterized protein (TIGR02453 family)